MITKSQRITLMAELWPAACRQQGWDENDKTMRYAVFAEVLGDREPHKSNLAAGGHISANDFLSEGERDDFGAIKRHLLLLSGKDLLQADPVRRRLLWIVTDRLMPCYRVYKPGAALETILRERFSRIKGVNTIDDLSLTNVKKLIYTLTARVNTARKAAGDTPHEMCQAAEVQCWRPPPSKCPQCQEFIRQEVTAGEVPAENEPF